MWYGLILCIILHKNQLYSLSWGLYFLTWFLLTMFYSIVILSIINRVIEFNMNFLLKFLVFLMMWIFSLNYMNIDDNLHFSKIPFALFFIISGCIFSNQINLHKRNLLFEKTKYYLPILIGLLWVCSSFNSPVLWYINSYGNLLLMLLGAFLGIYIIMQCAYLLRNNELIRYWGLNSMTIYAYQFFVYRCFQGLFGKIISIDIFSVLCTIFFSMLTLTLWVKVLEIIKKGSIIKLVLKCFKYFYYNFL